MPDNFIPYVAKAIAALLVPWLIALAAWAATTAGVDIAVNPTWVETTVASVLSTLVVYFTRNRQASPE